MPKYKNILIALDGKMAAEKKVYIQKIFAKVLNSYPDKLQVGELRFVDSKEDIDLLVNGVDFDVLLCVERICGENIGAGSIKQWNSKNRILDIILFVNEKKKGGEKLRALFKDGYYNAVYDVDLRLRASSIIDLILQGRSADMAREYYGINDVVVEEPVLFSETVVTSSVETSVNEVAYVDAKHTEEKEVLTENVSDGLHVQEKEEMRTTESVISEKEEYNSLDNTKVVEATKEDVQEDEWFEEKTVESEPMKQAEVVSEESYVGYERYSNSEISVLHRKKLDASELGGESAVMVRGRIASVVSDTVMVIECPNGGFMKNKALVENRFITLLL